MTRIVWLFSLVLGHSRFVWARFLLHQDLQTVLRCHMAAFAAPDGVPRQILYDRMKTAVPGEDAEGHIVQSPEQRRAIRLAQTTPLIDDLRDWLEAMLVKVSGGSRIARAIRYALKDWAGLTVFLDGGRVEIDSNVVERTIRPLALNRKNALFAGSDQGGVHWGVIASLIETRSSTRLTPTPTSPTSRPAHRPALASQIDQLMPWAYVAHVP